MKHLLLYACLAFGLTWAILAYPFWAILAGTIYLAGTRR